MFSLILFDDALDLFSWRFNLIGDWSIDLSCGMFVIDGDALNKFTLVVWHFGFSFYLRDYEQSKFKMINFSSRGFLSFSFPHMSIFPS